MEKVFIAEAGIIANIKTAVVNVMDGLGVHLRKVFQPVNTTLHISIISSISLGLASICFY